MPAKGVAVVTGASYGLGASVAKEIKNFNLNLNLNLGASIAKQLACKVPKSKEKLRELQFEIAQANGVALVVEADITDAAAVQNLLDTTLKAFPKGVDVLVNNAAYVAPIHRFAEGDVEEWERMVAVNVWGALRCTRAFLPGMLQKKSGKVVFISSKAGVSPSPGLAVHSGTKHMVEAVAEAVRQEVKESGVKVGIVRPGGIATPGYDHAAGSSQSREVAAGLGCWVPADTSGCLRPEVVAAQVVNMVQALDDGADLTEISLISA